MREVIDLPGPGPELAPALVGADRGLRLGLGAAFLAAAALRADPWSPAAAALAATGILHGLDRLPRTAGAAGLALAALALLQGGPGGAGGAAPWLGVLAAAAVRTHLQWGPAGAHLARVRALRRAEARGVAAMELRRARAARLTHEEREERDRELRRAGDAFERAGRARAELRTLGVEGRAARLGRWAGPVLAALPYRLREAALRRLDA